MIRRSFDNLAVLNDKYMEGGCVQISISIYYFLNSEKRVIRRNEHFFIFFYLEKTLLPKIP